MAFNSIPQYDGSVAGNNTDVGGISIAEGYPAGNINNAMRQMLLQLKQYLAQSATVASASTVDLGAQTGNYVTITGTTTITSFGTVAAGTVKKVKAAAALPITYNATSMLLAGGASITMGANDVIEMTSEGSGNWRQTGYQKSSLSPQATVDASRCQGRLTAVSTVPIPATGTNSQVTTLYFTPYKGNQVAVYTGTAWQLNTFAEMSIAIPSTTNTNYDVFLDYNSGSPQLSLTAWSGDNARATALALQDGVYVLSGTTTKRYLGTIRTGAVSGNINDSSSQRYVWNYYNRVPRQMFAIDTTDSWTYSTASWRQANGATANKVEMVQGLVEDIIDATVLSVSSSAAGAQSMFVGVGIDSTTANSAQILQFGRSQATGGAGSISANYKGTLASVGYHSIVWLEQGAGAGTQTFYGDFGGPSQSGMNVTVWG